MTYATITMDPPWPETGGGGRGTGNHYPTMPVRQMPQVILMADRFDPADDSHLYMWTTTTHLLEAGWLMSMIGFRYVAAFPWVKPSMGMGQYFRTRAEFVLFGVRGDGMSVCNPGVTVEGLIEAPRGRHSEKPEAFFELVERRSRGPYLEMFARTARPGWDAWGNEIAA